ncbi:MAG: hypothetical protein IKZ58_07165 [Selenomonadaceae bacterium]|nr:hypothetical protein [Selenomonadaceae bacterium]
MPFSKVKVLNPTILPPSVPDNPEERENLFIDRRKNSPFLLNILAGYKPYLFEDVFARVKKFVPNAFDVCITSSGLFDKNLYDIAKNYGWSYLSTARNSIPGVQNLIMPLYENAQMIFKMDEDIFVTQNCFEKLLQTFNHCQTQGRYNVGFVAPLIPINGYGHVRILEKLGLDEYYEKNFEKIIYGAQHERMLEKSPEVAKFFWGEGNIIPSIDMMNVAFQIRKMEYRACPIKFSIGLILFHRNLWTVMGGWITPPVGSGGGIDEMQICDFCVKQSLAMIISENTVVGHLSFHPQNEDMKEYFLTHREKFRCP